MVNIRPLSPELQKKAIEELNEDPARLEKDIESFREWILKSPHIKGRTDDQFLVTFLRGCKFSLEKAKQKYDLFYTLKSHMSVFKNRDPTSEKNKYLLENSTGVLLPKSKIPGSPRYILIRPGAMDPEKLGAEDIMREISFMNETLMLDDDDFTVSGIVFIADHKGITLKHISIFNSPLTVKKMTTLIQDAFPSRQKGMHFFHMSSIMVALFNLFKSFMNEKNKSRLQVYGDNLEELAKIVPLDILPTEYGGDAGPIREMQLNNAKMISFHRDYFLEDENFGVDETKRVGKQQNSESLFGLEGSFRKLEID